MTVHTILKMGDARLLRVAQPVTAFDTPALHGLVRDMLDTMRAANGAGLAAPQIGVDLQLVVFGAPQPNPRYPGRPLVPPTVLAKVTGHTLDLSVDAAQTIQATADGITDPALRAALERLASHARPKP